MTEKVFFFILASYSFPLPAALDFRALGLADYGKPGNYYARQVERWAQQYEASKTGPMPDMEALIVWLKANVPADDGLVTLTHGDYRLDNILFHPTEPRVLAVLDWELSTLGHPMSDLAYKCVDKSLTRR